MTIKARFIAINRVEYRYKIQIKVNKIKNSSLQ